MDNVIKAGKFSLDFLGIGVYKASTSWLHICLEEHPDIYVPQAKEINYFSFNYQRGLSWYQSFFNAANDCVRGEVSPSYFTSPEIPSRIFDWNPEIRLLLLLRNPVERAYSHYCMDLRMGKVGEAIDQEITPFVKQGFYYDYLSNYLNYFRKDQILVMIQDDLKKDPRNFIRQVYAYLQVNENFTPSIIEKVYHQRKPRPKYENIYRLMYQFTRELRNNRGIMAHLFQLAKRYGLVELFHRMLPDQTYPELPFPIQREIACSYIDDVNHLSEWLGRDLGFWLSPYLES